MTPTSVPISKAQRTARPVAPDATPGYSHVLGKSTKRNFSIQPILNPNPLQAAILKDWLRDAQ